MKVSIDGWETDSSKKGTTALKDIDGRGEHWWMRDSLEVHCADDHRKGLWTTELIRDSSSRHALQNSCLLEIVKTLVRCFFTHRLRVTDLKLFVPNPWHLYPLGELVTFCLQEKSDGFRAFNRFSRDTTWLVAGESLGSVPEFAGLPTGSKEFEALGTSLWVAIKLMTDWLHHF